MHARVPRSNKIAVVILNSRHSTPKYIEQTDEAQYSMFLRVLVFLSTCMFMCQLIKQAKCQTCLSKMT
jgi:hypothetical protein